MSEERHVPRPPSSFTPAEDIVPAGTVLFRVHSKHFGPTVFNPGDYKDVRAKRSGLISPVNRYSYFYEDEQADLPIPAIYAGANENVALWETVLRDYQRSAGFIPRGNVKHHALSRVVTARDVRVASLAGADMAALEMEDDELRFSNSDRYSETVPWGRAAWRSGFDGIKYVSQRDSSGLAYVFFATGAGPVFRSQAPDDTLQDFDDRTAGGGFEWLSHRLRRWNIELA